MNNERRKQLREQYKQRTVTGGVYRIRNTANGRFHIDWDEDIASAEKSFRFFAGTGGPSRPDLRALTEEWRQYGPDSFVFEVLEELEKDPDQSREAFYDDCRTLLELWKEKDGIDMSLAYKK